MGAPPAGTRPVPWPRALCAQLTAAPLPPSGSLGGRPGEPGVGATVRPGAWVAPGPGAALPAVPPPGCRAPGPGLRLVCACVWGRARVRGRPPCTEGLCAPGRWALTKPSVRGRARCRNPLPRSGSLSPAPQLPPTSHGGRTPNPDLLQPLASSGPRALLAPAPGPTPSQPLIGVSCRGRGRGRGEGDAGPTHAGTSSPARPWPDPRVGSRAFPEPRLALTLWGWTPTFRRGALPLALRTPPPPPPHPSLVSPPLLPQLGPWHPRRCELIVP